MRIAVSSAGDHAGAPAEERFGRCAYFIIFENGNLRQVINNDGAASVEGAGIRSAQILIRNNVDVLLTGRVGPKAMHALLGGGVAVYTGVGGTVAESLEKYQSGLLKPLGVPNAHQHAGKNPPGRVVK